MASFVAQTAVDFTKGIAKWWTKGRRKRQKRHRAELAELRAKIEEESVAREEAQRAILQLEQEHIRAHVQLLEDQLHAEQERRKKIQRSHRKRERRWRRERERLSDLVAAHQRELVTLKQALEASKWQHVSDMRVCQVLSDEGGGQNAGFSRYNHTSRPPIEWTKPAQKRRRSGSPRAFRTSSADRGNISSPGVSTYKEMMVGFGLRTTPAPSPASTLAEYGSDSSLSRDRSGSNYTPTFSSKSDSETSSPMSSCGSFQREPMEDVG